MNPETIHQVHRQPAESEHTLIVGIGSAHGDDQAGWLVVTELQRQVCRQRQGLTFRVAKSPSDLLNWFGDVARLIICDARESPTFSSDIGHWRWPSKEFTRTRSASSHQLGLADVLDLAMTLNCLPAQTELWAIGGSSFAPGSEPSLQVRSACVALANRLAEELARA